MKEDKKMQRDVVRRVIVRTVATVFALTLLGGAAFAAVTGVISGGTYPVGPGILQNGDTVTITTSTLTGAGGSVTAGGAITGATDITASGLISGGSLNVTGTTTLTGNLNANGTTNNIGTTSASTVNTIGSLNYSANRLYGDTNLIQASDENDIIAVNGNWIRSTGGGTYINPYSGDGLTTIGNDTNGLQVYGGATVNGGLTSNSGHVFLQTTAAGNPLNTPGNAYLDLTSGSNATLVYINSSDPLTSASYQATDTRLLSRYVTSSSYSTFFADANGVEASYYKVGSGYLGGLFVTDGPTTATTIVNGGNGAVMSTLTLDATKTSLVTADGSGLTVNNGVTAPGATAVSLQNSTGHGLTIKTDSTVLSGGTSSTSLTLNNWGATFNNNGPARVTGVADGETDYDAVNYRQLQKAYSGIASVSALAAIPSTMPGKKFAIGAGYGYFESESAVAIGMKASLFDSLSITAGVGFGVGSGPNSTASANAGFSYSF